MVHVTPQCRLRLSANSTVKRSDHELSSNAPRALRAGFEKKYSSGQRRATGRRAGQVGVSYAERSPTMRTTIPSRAISPGGSEAVHSSRTCPLRVNRVVSSTWRALPLYPNCGHFLGSAGRSLSCQDRSVSVLLRPFCAQGARFDAGQRRTEGGQAEGRTGVLGMTNGILERDIISAPADIRLGRAAARLLPPEWLRAACNSPRDLCSHRASSPRTDTSGGSCARRCARCLCP